MAETPISEHHRALIARMQHILEWLQLERTRLERELQHVSQQGQRVQGEMLSFLAQEYGVDVQAPLTVDSERGVIVTPDISSDDAAHDSQT